MSFFEPPARPPAGVARAKVVSPPAWIAPPHNVLPGIAPMQVIVARTDETVIAVAGIQAYPAGFSFTLSLRLRNLSAQEEQRLPYLFDSTDPEDDPLAGDFLRFGVQFADGRKATTLDHPPTTQRAKRQTDQCCGNTAGAVAAPPGTWSTGYGRCHQPGRSPSYVSGRAEASRSRGPRSTRS
jgi:hypothetical protein